MKLATTKVYLPEHADEIRVVQEVFGEEWSQRATLDDVCEELERAGCGNARALRSVAIARVGERFVEKGASPINMVQALYANWPKMAVWVCYKTAMHALRIAKADTGKLAEASRAIESMFAMDSLRTKEDEDLYWGFDFERDYSDKALGTMKALDAFRSVFWVVTIGRNPAESKRLRGALVRSLENAQLSIAHTESGYSSYVMLWDRVNDSEADTVRLMTDVMQTFPVLLTAPG